MYCLCNIGPRCVPVTATLLYLLCWKTIKVQFHESQHMIPTCTPLFYLLSLITEHFSTILPYNVSISLSLFHFPTLCSTSDTVSHTWPQLCGSEQTHPLLLLEAEVTVDCVCRPDWPNLCTVTTGNRLSGQEHGCALVIRINGSEESVSWDTQIDTQGKERKIGCVCVFVDRVKHRQMATITAVCL